MKTLHKSDIEELDTRYEKLANEAHSKYFNDPEAFYSKIESLVYEAFLILGLRKTADAIVAEYSSQQDINTL